MTWGAFLVIGIGLTFLIVGLLGCAFVAALDRPARGWVHDGAVARRPDRRCCPGGGRPTRTSHEPRDGRCRR